MSNAKEFGDFQASGEPQAGGLIDFGLLFKYTIILLAGIIIGKVFL